MAGGGVSLQVEGGRALRQVTLFPLPPLPQGCCWEALPARI
jgi:hypothetical protein